LALAVRGQCISFKFTVTIIIDQPITIKLTIAKLIIEFIAIS